MEAVPEDGPGSRETGYKMLSKDQKRGSSKPEAFFSSESEKEGYWSYLTVGCGV